MFGIGLSILFGIPDRAREALRKRAFAEFERAMLKERTKAGLDAAREEGRVGGRRPKLSPQQQAEIKKMVSKGDKTAADAARLFKIHPATVSRLLARETRTKIAYGK